MGVLVEIDISDLVWDDQTDGSYKYAVDRIDEFIDEISNKILPYDFKQVSYPVILIQLNNKLISQERVAAQVVAKARPTCPRLYININT